MEEPTIESLQAQLAESTKEIEALKATAESVAAERATEKVSFEKQLEDLKAASAKELEDELKALSETHEKALKDKDAEVNEKAFRLALKQYGKVAPAGKTETATSKDELQKQYDAVKHDVFARARFLKSLSKTDRETLVPSRKNREAI